jgi:hypothetical protein
MIEKAMADSMRAGSLGSAGGVGGTGVIIGSQPALDVDALLRRTQSEDTRQRNFKDLFLNYSQTCVNDHLQIATTCLQRPQL